MYNSDSNVMKRSIIGLVCLLIGALFMTSCLKDNDEVVKSSEVALLTFGIKDLKTVHVEKDSTYTTVMNGSTVEFSIDQVKRLVYNRDSISYGTDVHHVPVKVTADGYVYYVKQSGELGSVEDSIDFTSPVTFRVKSYDGQYARDYLVSINVHQVDPKETVWVKLGVADFPTWDELKAFVKGERLYVIGIDDKGAYYSAVAPLDNEMDWTVTACEGIDGSGFSALLVDEVFYLHTDVGLYRSEDALEWSAVEDETVISGLPAGGISRGIAFFSEPLNTNETVMRTIFVATPEQADTCAQVWTKLSTENEWIEIGASGNNVYGCPNLEHLAVIHYAGKMYAFGGESVGPRKKPLGPFGNCYESRDNGVTWKGEEKRYEAAFGLPEGFKQLTGPFSAVTDGEYVWVIWSDGLVWRGRWNGIK